METASGSVELTESEALCLEAIRAGLEGNTAMALKIKRDLKTVAKALERLRQSQLIRRHNRTAWRTTQKGEFCGIYVIPDHARGRRGRKSGEVVAGSASDGLLRLLDRPRHGQEVLEHLGISRQRLHQLIIRFHAEKRLRFGDPSYITHVLARSDDPSVLLTRREERLISAMTQGVATTTPRLAAITSMSGQRTGAIVASLVEKDLMEACGEHRNRRLYRLTAEGRDHFQRRDPARAIEPMPLEVKSDRVYAVLTCLAEHQQMRTRDLGEMVGIPLRSMNALMQYLKRKGMVEKTGDAMFAPYMLARKGHETLEEMTRRRIS